MTEPRTLDGKPIPKIGWTCCEISAASPIEDLDSYFKEAHPSYKTLGAVGDQVAVQGLFTQGRVLGKVVQISAGYRMVECGETLFQQEWVGGKYWLDFASINKRAIQKLVMS